MYETIAGMGQIEQKVPEMERCLSEMDEAVSGMKTAFESLPNPSSEAMSAINM
jgi:methyl-accepting chemotaxis protein